MVLRTRLDSFYGTDFVLPGRGGPRRRSICEQATLEIVLRSPTTSEVVSQETEACPLPITVLPPTNSPTEMRRMWTPSLVLFETVVPRAVFAAGLI